MADDNTGPASVKVIAATVPIVAPPAPPPLSVRSVNVVIDSHNKSPGGMATEICEIALYPLGEGNADWMQWGDLVRFRCERGASNKILKALGLAPAK